MATRLIKEYQDDNNSVISYRENDGIHIDLTSNTADQSLYNAIFARANNENMEINIVNIWFNKTKNAAPNPPIALPINISIVEIMKLTNP